MADPASWWAWSNRRVPRPWQVNIRPASARRPSSIWASSLVGGLRVPAVESDGAAEGHPVVHRHRPGRPVHPDHGPDQVVGRAGVADPLVDHTAHEQPVGLDAQDLARVEVLGDLADQALHGRYAGHLVDDVPVGAGHREGVTVGPAPLRHQGLHIDAPSDQHAGGPVGDHPGVGTRRRAPGPRPPDALPPTTGRPGRRSASQVRKSAAGKVNGSANNTSAVGSKPSGSGQPVEVPSSVGQPGGGETDGDQGPDPAGPQTDGRGLLDLPARFPPPTRRRPRHGQRVQHGSDGADDVLERAGVGAGDRHHDQVGAFADGLEDGADDLADRLGGHRVLREGAGEGHPVSRPVAGSGCRGSGGRCGGPHPGWGRGRRDDPTRCGGCARARAG